MLSIHILFTNYFSVLKFRTLVLRDVLINITYKTLLYAKSHKTPKEIFLWNCLPNICSKTEANNKFIYQKDLKMIR